MGSAPALFPCLRRGAYGTGHLKARRAWLCKPCLRRARVRPRGADRRRARVLALPAMRREALHSAGLRGRDARRHPDGHAVDQAGRRLTPIQTGASRSGRRNCAADGIGVKAWRSACGVPYRPRYRHVPGPRWPRSRGGTGEFKGMVERYNGLPETPFLPGSSFTSRVGPFHVKHADLSRAGRRVRGDIRAVVPGR